MLGDRKNIVSLLEVINSYHILDNVILNCSLLLLNSRNERVV